jgi:predicted GTPase
VTLIVVDATQPDDWRLNELAERVRNGPRLCPVLNKIDAVDGAGSLVRALERMRELGFGSEPLLVSALRGTHVADLKDELVAAAQPGDWEVDQRREKEDFFFKRDASCLRDKRAMRPLNGECTRL